MPYAADCLTSGLWAPYWPRRHTLCSYARLPVSDICSASRSAQIRANQIGPSPMHFGICSGPAKLYIAGESRASLRRH